MGRRGELGISDCLKCKKMTPVLQRQYLGCGYEPRLDRVHLTMWSPPSGQAGYQGPDPTICAGYTTNLPEVIEAALMRRHWLTGNLDVALMGDAATEDLLSLIVIIDNANSEVENWRMTPAADGGGGR